MLLAAHLKRIFSKNSQQSTRQQNIIDAINHIWECLKSEYGLGKDIELIFVKSYKEYPNEVARKLATMGYTTGPESCKYNGSDNLSTPLMMTRYYYASEGDVIIPKCVGVFCMWDALYNHIKYDTDEMNLKLRCIECILRHEIGHVLSFDRLFKGMTYADACALNNDINETTNLMQSKWKPGRAIAEQLYDYYDLPLEKVANETAGITSDMLVDAMELLIN